MGRYVKLDAAFRGRENMVGPYTAAVFWTMVTDPSVELLVDHETGELVFDRAGRYLAEHWVEENGIEPPFWAA